MKLSIPFLMSTMAFAAMGSRVNLASRSLIEAEVEEAKLNSCEPVSIDFSNLASGVALPTDYYSSLNVTVTGTPRDSERCKGAHVVDLSDPTAGCDANIGEPGDNDLYAPALGNGIVLKNSSVTSCVIDDCGRGGDITFDFSSKINVKYIQLLDLDEPGTISIEHADGTTEDLGEVKTPNGETIRFAVNRNNVVRLTVSLKRSGAITELMWKKCGDTPGGSGDPHFKTWSGHKFDYHGQCDIAFLHAPSAAEGKGLDIHVRTQQQDFYSYINKVAIKVGENTLEVGHDYALLDGISQTMPFDASATLDGYPVLYKKEVTKTGRDQEVYRVLIGEGEMIEVKVFNLFISVKVHGATHESFSDSTGILGHFYSGRMLARDGVTVLSDPNEYGAEWQVSDKDIKLFHSAEEPQFPNQCIPAQPMETGRKLRHGITLGKATEACADWGEDIEDCVFDIMATGNLDLAGAF